MARPSGEAPVSAARVITPLVMAGLAYATAQTTIMPVVPEIQRATGSSAGQVAWVVTGFFVTSAALTVLEGRLGDLFGKKTVLLVVLAVFTVGAAIAALGTSLGPIIVGRTIMGAAGGVFPLAYSILGQRLPRQRAALGIGLISSMFGVGGALGLPAGGLVAHHLGHHGLFWATAALAVLALVLVAVFVPADRGERDGGVDWLGALLLGASLSGVLIALSRAEEWGWTAPWTLGLFGAGVVTFAALVVVETRVSHPLVDLRLMRQRNVWVANLVTVLITIGPGAMFFLIPQTVQLPEDSGVGLGVDVAQAGLFLLPAASLTLVVGPLIGRITTRFGVRQPLVASALSAGVGLTLLAVGGANPAVILVGGATVGLAGAMSFAVLPILIADSVPAASLGAANGVNTVVRHVSMALAAQLVAALLVLGTPPGARHPQGWAFTLDYGLAAALGLAALLLIGLLRVRPRETAAAEPRTRPVAEHTTSPTPADRVEFSPSPRPTQACGDRRH